MQKLTIRMKVICLRLRDVIVVWIQSAALLPQMDNSQALRELIVRADNDAEVTSQEVVL